VARGRAARRGDRGGGGIPAVRATPRRLTLATSAVAGAVALVVWRIIAAPSSGSAQVVGIVGGLGAAVVLLAVAVPVSTALPWALLALAAAYGLGLPVHVGSTDQATVYGLGLLAVAELAYGSLQAITRVRGEPGTWRVRLGALLGVVVATLVADSVTIDSARLSTGDAFLLVVAAAGVVLLVGAIAALVAGRRTGRDA
jgi:hypothetical protein